MKKIIFGFMAVLAIFAILSCDNGSTPKKKVLYDVTFNANGADSGTAPAKITQATEGANVTIPGNTGSLVKEGFNFEGWNEKNDGTGTNYMPGASFKPTKNTTLYAKWEPEIEGTVHVDGYILPEFTNQYGDGNWNGWLTNGVDDVETDLTMEILAAAKYLVIKSNSGANANGYGGIKICVQGDGNNWASTETEIISDGWLNFPHTALDNVFFVIELAKLTDWADVITGTQAKIAIGMWPFSDLGLQDAYLVSDEFEMPETVTDLSNDTGFITLQFHVNGEVLPPVGGGEGPGVDPTNPENPGYTVPTYPPVVANGIVEEVTLNNGWAVIFQFVLPEGRHWEDYSGVTVDYKIDTVTEEVRARAWGNYVPSEVNAANFGIYNGKNIAVVGSWPGGSSGRWIWNNTYGTITPVSSLFGANATPNPPTDNAWFTAKYKTDGSGAHNDWKAGAQNPDNATYLVGRDPAGNSGAYAGPFYFGFGLSFGNDGGAKAVVSQIKNVTLKGYDNTIDDIVGMPLYYKSADGSLYRAFVGQLDGAKDETTGLSPGFNSGRPAWEIISGEELIKAAAIPGKAPNPPALVTITFNANYDEDDDDFAAQPDDITQTIIKGAKADSLPVLSRKGFTFLGWYPDADGNGTKVTANDTYDNDVTLYGKWEVFVLPDKVTVTGTDLDALIVPAWGASVISGGDNDGFIIMADATYNAANGGSSNDSLINISFPDGLSPAFNMFRIYYDYVELQAPTITDEEVAAGWVKDAGGIAKKFNSADNAGNPGSYFSFNQNGGVLDRTFNDNVTVTSGMSIQINKGDDANNKQRRAGLAYGIKITKIEFVFRISTVVDGSTLAGLVAAAWGAKTDSDGFIVMADATYNGTNGASANDSLINIEFPQNLDLRYDKFIITYTYKAIVTPPANPAVEAGDGGADDPTGGIAHTWEMDPAGVAKKFNTADNAGNPSSYFSFNTGGGSIERTFNANVTLTSGMSIQINKGDDVNKANAVWKQRDGLVYGIKITKIEFFLESPAP
jgi:uncharacterized repeat protein (TIGR02543 family)